MSRIMFAPKPSKLDQQKALFGAAKAVQPPKGVTWHPYSEIFPLIDGPAFDDLVADIKANGVLEPVVMLDGAVLDGRNRLLAANRLGIKAPTIEYTGTDPLGFVISHNLKRRHLTDSQRAMVAAKIANLPKGRPSRTTPIGSFSADAAARVLNVPKRSIVRAKTVQSEGAPELVQAVEAGAVSVSAAADIASLPVEKQVEVIRAADPKAFAKVAKDVRAQKQAAKKERRTEREVELAGKIKALPTEKYGVIASDPEWSWQAYSAETGMDRAAENHYPTSSTEVIAQRDVASIAADDCVLFLWATAPMLPDALKVMEAWGFTYKSQFIWLKDKVGTGYWNRNKHEILLVGTKGNIPAPAMGDQWESVIEAPVGEHSAKPERFLEMIEGYFPNLPKIELNRRGPARDEWAAWGAEVEEAA